jgi:hypothetical protein
VKYSVFIVAIAVALLLSSAAADAQNLACTPQTAPAQVAFGRTNITFQSPGHTELDPAGLPKITDYFGEVRVRGQAALVTNFTIPKTSVTPFTGPGIPSGCFQTQLPAMAGLLPSDVYTLTLYARNTASSPPKLAAAPETADFFLEEAAAPRSPARLSFVTP